MPASTRVIPRLRLTNQLLVLLASAIAGLSGCGSTSSSQHQSKVLTRQSTATTTGSSGQPPPPPRLGQARTLTTLPEARSGVAVAAFNGSIVVSGGLSSAGESTSSVFRIGPGGSVSSAPALPGPVHDASAAELGGRLLLFGGGQFEGSDRIIETLPATPRQIGTLPQSLSDLTAVTIGGRAYVVGGWNGTTTNRTIYAVSGDGQVSTAGTIPVGVRYPAVAALAGRVIVAGGETTSGSPTKAVWSFDLATERSSPLPDLPVATDHGAGVALNGRFYLLGGLRNGVFTRAILSWAPGETRWQAAGKLPIASADFGAVPFDGGIAVVGGRDSAGKVASVTLLTAG